MLFNSIVPQVFARMDLDRLMAASEARKEEARRRLDYYQGDHLDRLGTLLARYFSEPEAMQQVCLNITRKVILQLAQVYREPPRRVVEGSKLDQDTFNEIADGLGLDVKLKQAQRLVKLLKTCLLRPVWRGGRLDLDILTPDLLDVATGDTPEALEAIMVTHLGAGTRPEDVTYSLWTPETWRLLNYRGHTVQEEANPYGVLPFVPCWDSAPLADFWQPGGDDLVSAQEALNLKLTDLMHLIRHQSFGVGYLKGVRGAGQMHVDPGALLELPENGEVGFVSQEAEIAEVVESIKFLIRQVAVMHGLSAASMSLDPSTASGVSKVQDSKELAELRADDVALWRRYEKNLFGVTRAVWNHHNPTVKLSEGATLSLDFADAKPTMSPQEQATTWERLLDLGVITAVDIAMERNPDITTREEALEHLLKLQEEQGQLNETKI